jgi:hypothetical protein
MADPRAGIDIVAAEPGAHQLLDEERLSLVQRLEVMPPSARAPYCALIAFSRPAVKASASSQLTSRHGWSMVSRIIGVVIRSWWLA